MTDSTMPDEKRYPHEIWALDDQIEYPRLWEKEPDEDGVSYTRTDTIQAKDRRIAELEAEVAELRTNNSALSDDAHRRLKLVEQKQAQLKTMAGALGFYADAANWQRPTAEIKTLVEQDGGDKARTALKPYTADTGGVDG